MIKILHFFIFLIASVPVYSWECLDDMQTAFGKAKSAYVIKISSKTDIHPEEKKELVKYKIIEVLKDNKEKNQEKKHGEVIDTIGLLPNYVGFDVGYFYILFLKTNSENGDPQDVTGCSVHAKARTLEDKYFISILKELKRL